MIAARGRFTSGASSCRCRRRRLALCRSALPVDWTLAGAVLFVLLPRPRAVPRRPRRVSAAQSARPRQPRPGGVGVFEGLMVLLLKPSAPGSRARAGRVPCHLLFAAVVRCAGHAHRRRSSRRRHTPPSYGVLGRFAEQLTPRCWRSPSSRDGAVVLGRDAGAAGRLAILDRVFPLGVIETSHFVGSVAGADCCCCRRDWPGVWTPRTT